MTDFAIQLYSLRAVEDTLPQTITRIGATDLSGVEFAGLDGAQTDDVRAALDESGLAPVAAHVSLDDIESSPDEVAATYEALGCEHIVVPWLDPEHFTSTAAVDAAANRLATAADEMAERGFSFHYHTHDQEFVDVKGELALARLLDGADGVGLELDLGWAGAAGVDPIDTLNRFGDRIELAHLKGYDRLGGDPCEVGAGALNVEEAVGTARDHDVAWLVFESEADPDTYEALDAAERVLSDLGSDGVL
ncbi:sugar phosphate isomerase/epimerase family protein [Halobaculum limi]|uniref:sugar phosphate isomerase/epimerase family protein n=1 Tax=Halobaculum limi TaxID=3031916 RepID=UPI002406CDCF|nr:sugar phosphate isomerase/epimerase [Halobaculum sp. YSMS11]